MNKFEDNNVEIFSLTDMEDLLHHYTSVNELYLFGSRRYDHQSLRSDIDILVVSDSYIKPSLLRQYTEHSPALDLFVVEGARATSCINESYIETETFDELISILDAVKVWTRDDGFIEPPGVKTSFKIRKGLEFVMTCLDNEFVRKVTFEDRLFEIARKGLPTKPLISDSFYETAEFLSDIAQRMLFDKEHFSSSRGAAKNSWVTNLKSEYDFQDIFEVICKPFIPNLAREEVEIRYDGKKKLSDFSFFDSQIIVEMKYINNGRKASEVVKTLKGLSNFYKQNSNVKALLFLIYVEPSVKLDDQRWEIDYSYRHSNPIVLTKVIRNK